MLFSNVSNLEKANIMPSGKGLEKYLVLKIFTSFLSLLQLVGGVITTDGGNTVGEDILSANQNISKSFPPLS